MRISILGGGAAGLYFAILMKRQDPARRIEVLERNRPDDTFGFGVVFSDQTFGYLEQADPESAAAIQGAFEVWDNVDVVHRDERVTIRGNRFSGISRLVLLELLHRRCRELEIELAFQTEVADLARFAGADLVVGADGVNSTVRRLLAGRFEPALVQAANPYVWYGTPHLFHGLTLTFRESPDGVFIAHSYKFSRDTSTFIIETDPATWKRGGYDTLPEPEARARLERVFASDLAGQPLLVNNSKWLRFLVVTNRRWHADNVVLLGDALHTAHFSIGSGTKLALEDAIALATAFQAEGGRVDRALPRFEVERRPKVEATQAAALLSMGWFERAHQLMGRSTLELAYEAMTRSTRVDLENLRKRDPEFVARWERHAGRRA